MRALRSSFTGFAIAAALVAAPAIAQAQPAENIQMRFAGAAAGEWSGKGKFVPGPPDGSCSNMGAEGKVNLTSEYGFELPDDANVTGVTAFIKAGAKGGQTVGVQLASDASQDPPSLLGAQRNDFPVTDAPSGNCAETQISSIDGGLLNWGDPVLNAAIVNAPEFGLVFVKLEQSEIKVDAVCLQIHYTSVEGEEVQEECFGVAPSSITVIKEVAGDVPDSDWAFEFNGGPFPLPADGGVQIFTPLEPGDYDIEEATKAGWAPSVSCTDGAGSNTDFVTVELGEEENVTCIFTNMAEPATITVVKELAAGSADPDEDWGFSFDDDDFFLDAGEQRVFDGLPSGTYNIAEDITLDFRVAVSCDNGASGGDSVDVTVEPGDDVTCTFTNRRVSAIPAVGPIGLGVLALMLAGLARRRMR